MQFRVSEAGSQACLAELALSGGASQSSPGIDTGPS
jgi:hypothetical protein